jgi:CubicO group peptidase (beta-lactamase class C family)
MGAYRGAVPGASVLVLHEGVPVFRRAYGLSDLERRIAATGETNYRLASLSKQFTSAAVLLLAQEGRIELDTAVHKWLPGLPNAARTVTVRHLLTHTAGLIDYEDLVPEGRTAQLHDADVLELLQSEDRTYFVPGTRYRYSNSGYALLALMVAAASDMDFSAMLSARIFGPLGMRHTVAYQEGITRVVNRAYGYSAKQQSWLRTDQDLTSAVLGDGGIYSSIDDLEQWDAALYDHRLLDAESLRLAFAPAVPTDHPATHYGYGWRITGDTVWHSGETIGFRNVIVRYPARRFTVVVLTNRNDPEPYLTALAIAEGFKSPGVEHRQQDD